MGFRARYMTLLVALAAAAVVVAVSVAPAVHFAYPNRAIHVGIETAAALIALITVELVRGRYRRSARSSDLALFTAILLLAGTSLFFATIPALAGGHGTFSVWAPLLGRVLAGAAFAVSVVVPDRRVRRPSWTGTAAVAGALLALAAIAACVAIFEDHLPLPGEASMSSRTSGHPVIRGSASVLALEALIALLYGVAAVGFVRRAERGRDELAGWFGIGLTLGAFAALAYFLFPPRHPDWIYVGDILRVSWYLVLLLGAAREIAAYQERLAETAVLEERRRIARELHDGLAQELAFILGQVRGLADPSGGVEGPFKHLVTAAERALDESRAAIAALTRPVREPLDVTLAQAAEEVAGRVGARLRLELDGGVEVDADTRAALARIVREAVGNAARHGQAETITVSLSNGPPGMRIAVRDDGRGFDPAEPPHRGFGLTSMRERAEAIGGEFQVRSQPGAGTEVEVRLR